MFEGKVLLSSKPRFRSRAVFDYKKAKFDQPNKWNYKRLDDGRINIQWEIKQRSNESLIITEHGLHSVVVRPYMYNDEYAKDYHIIEFRGRNTAWIPGLQKYLK